MSAVQPSTTWLSATTAPMPPNRRWCSRGSREVAFAPSAMGRKSRSAPQARKPAGNRTAAPTSCTRSDAKRPTITGVAPVQSPPLVRLNRECNGFLDETRFAAVSMSAATAGSQVDGPYDRKLNAWYLFQLLLELATL